MKRVSSLELLLLLITLGTSSAVNPGFQTAITSNGLNYSEEVELLSTRKILSHRTFLSIQQMCSIFEILDTPIL